MKLQHLLLTNLKKWKNNIPNLKTTGFALLIIKAVLGFAGAMGDDRGVGGFLGHFDAVHGFRQGADLVQLDQDGVAHAAHDAVGQKGRIGDEDVVAYQLHPVAQHLGEHFPAVPVAFGQTVFDGHDGKLFGQIGVVIRQLNSSV